MRMWSTYGGNVPTSRGTYGGPTVGRLVFSDPLRHRVEQEQGPQCLWITGTVPRGFVPRDTSPLCHLANTLQTPGPQAAQDLHLWFWSPSNR